MAINTFFLQSHDGFTLEGLRWRPEKVATKACVVLIHGLGEHIRRYAHVAEEFNKHHICFIGLDMRGHGRSEGKRGHTPSIKYLMDDIQLLISHVQDLYPNTPIFMYGHSLGGMLTANYLYTQKPKIKGAIISAPLLKLAFEPPTWQVTLGKIASKIYPALSQENGLDAYLLSKDKAVCDAYLADPLVHSKITAKMFTEMIDAGENVLAQKAAPESPVLLFHGESDKITSAKASKEWASKHPSTIEFTSLADTYHEPHNDLDKNRIIRMVIQWIEKLI
jgi:acylglycerol lipase